VTANALASEPLRCNMYIQTGPIQPGTVTRSCSSQAMQLQNHLVSSELTAPAATTPTSNFVRRGEAHGLRIAPVDTAVIDITLSSPPPLGLDQSNEAQTATRRHKYSLEVGLSWQIMQVRYTSGFGRGYS
jgi:hypothetical protein